MKNKRFFWLYKEFLEVDERVSGCAEKWGHRGDFEGFLRPFRGLECPTQKWGVAADDCRPAEREK